MPLLCPFTFPSGSWCRPASHRSGCVVLWLPASAALPCGFALWLHSSGGSLLASAPCGGSTAVLLSCPLVWLSSALLSAVPRPVAHGSRTAGSLLPW
ncbi:MAG: hypothetical protein KME42_03690 [Tildeniella nuda ZEHNDER 1965/U140]|nr:hypothetical protein [Tildeniella nuda ZEHNDER 1965/U140]